MKDPGYTLSDLDGELRALGIDLQDIDNLHVEQPTAYKAAKAVERDCIVGDAENG